MVDSLSLIVESLKEIEYENEEIMTNSFLNACDKLVKLFDVALGEGVLSNQLKGDVKGNVASLRKAYMKNPAKFNIIPRCPKDVLVKLLWLKR